MRIKTLAIIMCLILILSVSISFSENVFLEQDEYYEVAQVALGYYLTHAETDMQTLESIQSRFNSLKSYGYSQAYIMYVQIMIEIEKDDYSTAEQLLEWLNNSHGFKKYLIDEGSKYQIGSLSDLEYYMYGRKAEAENKTEEACEEYQYCVSFFDTNSRMMKQLEIMKNSTPEPQATATPTITVGVITPTPQPTAVDGFEVQVTVKTSSIQIKWPKVKNARKYVLYRSCNGGEWKRAINTEGNEHTDVHYEPGSETVYYVEAYGSNGMVLNRTPPVMVMAPGSAANQPFHNEYNWNTYDDEIVNDYNWNSQTPSGNIMDLLPDKDWDI